MIILGSYFRSKRLVDIVLLYLETLSLHSFHCCLMPIHNTKTDMVHCQNGLTVESGTDLRFDSPSMVHTWCYVDVTPCPLYAYISDGQVRYVSEISSGWVGPLSVQGTVVSAYHCGLTM